MRASWERHSAAVMDRGAVEYPDRYLGIAAHLIPKEIEATIGGQRPIAGRSVDPASHQRKSTGDQF
jgi:hypothetical protein